MTETIPKGRNLEFGMTFCHLPAYAMTEIYAKSGLAHLLLIYTASSPQQASAKANRKQLTKLKHKEL
jgi:hypothetical protein